MVNQTLKRQGLLYRTTHYLVRKMVRFSKMFIGLSISMSDQSNNNTWRLSVSHSEEFKKDIEKAEQVILDISLYSMPFIVAFLVKVVVL